MNKKLAHKVKLWRYDPRAFVVDVFGVEPTWQQVELLTALVSGENPGIAVRSGHGCGKSACLSWVLVWFLLTRPGAKILATAPGRRQLKDILWTEVSMWVRKAIPVVRDMLNVQAERIQVQDRTDWFARAAAINTAASAEEQAESLAGYHHKHFMAIIDEASGVPEPVFQPVEGFLTREDNFVIMTSNPTRTGGYFYKIFNDEAFSDGWTKIHWNSEKSPIVSAEWVERMGRRYGRDSDTYRIRVLGEFPIVGEYSLIPENWIRRCVDPDLCEETVANRQAPVFWGLDVALQGADKTALVRRCGNDIYAVDTLAKGDTLNVVNWVIGHYQRAELKPQHIFVDVTGGTGAGPADILRRELPSGCVVSVNVSASAFDKDYYFRLRDELWWRVRTGFEFAQWRIPADEGLIRELASIRATKLEGSGKVKIESKDKMRARGVSSPDKGDAFCLVTYLTGMPGVTGMRPSTPRRRRITNWKVA